MSHQFLDDNGKPIPQRARALSQNDVLKIAAGPSGVRFVYTPKKPPPAAAVVKKQVITGSKTRPVVKRSNTWGFASGTSAVAIDNKIEQAMDLVKSHLMFAVREEVEVLKEKIAELMDRINQLELENTILKAHASQETLAQLSGNNPQQQGNKNQQTQPPSNGSVS